MTDNDPLRARSRPGGIRVEAEAATWESTVFAISAGTSVRYLEVPAEQVVMFLAAVDAGRLDDELAGIAGTPTGTTKERPGRVRAIVAFDRVLRGALSRAERDPATGQLAEPGSREHKRQRDDHQGRHRDQSQSSHSQAGAGQPVAAGVGAGTGAAVVTVVAAGPGVGAVGSSVAAASRSWWSSPVVAVGAVVAVVVVVAGTVFALTRPADETVTTAAAAVSTPAETGAPPAVSAATASAGAAVSSGPVSSAAVSSAAVSSAAVSSASPAAGAAPVGSAPASPAPGAPGSNNPFAGTYTFVRTVTENSGNENFPVGTTDSGSVTLTAACDEPTCAIDGDQFGVPTISGNQLAFAGTASEPCEDPPGITVQLGYTVTLEAAPPAPVDGVLRVASMQGVGTFTVTDLAGCNAGIAPITSSYELTRTG